MPIPLTKRGPEVFADTDSGGNPRTLNPTDVEIWSDETDRRSDEAIAIAEQAKAIAETANSPVVGGDETTEATLALPPLLIIGLGDSRMVGGNANVGVSGAAPTNEHTYFYQHSTQSFVDGDINQEPFAEVTGVFNNNVMRVWADALQKRTGRRVIVMWHGVSGSLIWPWLSPSSDSHSNGSGDVADQPWFDFKAKYDQMILTDLGVEVAKVYGAFVLLGANNGAGESNDFVEYMGNLVDQLREIPTAPGVPVIWGECANSYAVNTENQNRAIRNFFERRKRVDTGLVPFEAVGTSDATHETSEQMELLRPRLIGAMASLNTTYPPVSKALRLRTMPSGTSSGSPMAQLPGQSVMYRNTASTNGYIAIDASDYELGQEVEFRATSVSGKDIVVQMLNGTKIDYIDRPGYFSSSVTIPNGSYAVFYRVDEAGEIILRLKFHAASEKPFCNYVGNGSLHSTAPNGQILDRWTLERAVGITLSSGVSSSILRAGNYSISCGARTLGDVGIDVKPSGGSWAVKFRGDGVSQIQGNTYLNPGDQVRARMLGGFSRDIDYSGGYAWFSIQMLSAG